MSEQTYTQPDNYPSWEDADIDIVGRGGSGEIDTLCPKCSATRKNSRHRCLSANLDKGTFICHHCGWYGGIVPEGRWSGPPPKKFTRPTDVGSDTSDQTWTQVLKWFAARGISKEVVTRRRIQSVFHYMPQVEQKVNCIAFPYYRDDVLINAKYRDKDKNFCMVGGAQRIFYGLDDLKDETWCGIVEGECDALAMEMAGYKNFLSIPDGAPDPKAKNYASKFNFLDDPRAVAIIDRMEKIVIAVDADEPGKHLENELIRRIGPERCFIVHWPEGIKDANECLMKAGPAYLAALVEECEPAPYEGIIRVTDLAERLDALYDGDVQRGASTGLLSLDQLFRPVEGLLTIVTGIPSVGKSLFVDNLIDGLIESSGWRFGICSPEYMPLERHLAGLISIRSRLPFFDEEGSIRMRMSRETMHRTRDFLHDYIYFLHPRADMKLDSILERARILALQVGIKGLVIDPWNELEHLRPHGMSETEYIGWALGKISDFLQRHGIHGFVVAHPTKMRESDNGPAVVQAYDINASANWFNKADQIISLWRPDEGMENSNITDVHVLKIRFSETGKKGMAQFRFDVPTARFSELSEARS